VSEVELAAGREGLDVGAEAIFAFEAAVGLLRRSIELLLIVVFLVGVGTRGGAFRDRAREAAVGANNPVEGVFGRAEGVGVLAPVAASDREGVFALAGVAGAFVAALLVVALEVTDCPVC